MQQGARGSVHAKWDLVELQERRSIPEAFHLFTRCKAVSANAEMAEMNDDFIQRLPFLCYALTSFEDTLWTHAPAGSHCAHMDPTRGPTLALAAPERPVTRVGPLGRPLAGSCA